jgi:uncharacterized protein YdaU (DUF1376 family)
MTDRELPMLPWYPTSFVGSTMHFSFEERSVYRALLDAQWIMGPLPTDLSRLARLVGVDDELFTQVWLVVSSKFVLTNEGWINRRLEEHRAQSNQLKARRTEAARRASHHRWTGNSNGERSEQADGKMRDASVADTQRIANGSNADPNRMRLLSPLSPSPSPSPDSKNLSTTTQSAADVSHETSLPDKSLPPSRNSNCDAFASALDCWQRDVPECNAEKYGEWINDLEQRGKRLGARARLLGARWLSHQGDQSDQAEIIEFCLRNQYRRLIRLDEVRGEQHRERRPDHATTLARIRKRADQATGEDLYDGNHENP